MAPVGSYEALHAAIQAGAGSVYFGVGNLNMRSRSSNNFTINDLREIASIAKEYNIKSYLTVNTVIFDNELIELQEIITAAKESGITAIIVSDMAAIMAARTIGIEVHISTQLNITNIEALKFYAQFADVVVLAREMDLEKVYEINRQIKEQQIKGPGGKLVQTEMFIHGALCMAVSGKCYLSLHEMNASANRGDCMQVCRRGYTVTEKELGYQLDIDNEYIMSPKDLKTIHFLNKILDAGVTVLKIEGRARSAEYVKTVVSCYHEAVDAYFADEFDEKKIDGWNTRLASVFNRGFWDGYYLGQRLGEWSHNYGSAATMRKIYIGKGLNYFANIGVAEFRIETKELKVGDKILIIGPTTGVIETTVEEIRVDLKEVDVAHKGSLCSIPVKQKVRRADKLYLLVDASTIKKQ
ncbi:MAG TPA: U32 family peptidase [Prolixibacteraceae bacterium]|nr:U32 family peptidase [Prolixibacteraceae bacterium]